MLRQERPLAWLRRSPKPSSAVRCFDSPISTIPVRSAQQPDFARVPLDRGASAEQRRDCDTLAILGGCGLRRAELACLPFEKIQIRQGHWVIVDLLGKGGNVQTIPILHWVKDKLDRWTSA